jgi:Zn-dependent metalloprotease
VKFLKQGACLALLGGLIAVPALNATAVNRPAAVEPGTLAQMKDGAEGSVATRVEKATGKLGFVRAGRNGDLLPSYDGSAVDKSDKFLDKYAGLFGAKPDQLVQDSVTNKKTGSTVSYTQEYKGVPVFGSLLRVHLDAEGDLTAVNGYAAPGLSFDSVEPRISSEEAGKRAIAQVKADPPSSQSDDSGADKGAKADVGSLITATNELVIYREGAIRGVAGKNQLAHLVEVTNTSNVREIVFVSGETGKIVNRYSLLHGALDRKLYEVSPDTEPVWEEGDALPGTLNPDQESMVRSTGDSYWFFNNAFGRDSYDGAGASMRTVNNDPNIACPNANWNGATTNYCDGVSSDDVVAHEWGHAYTEYTHGLVYQWQQGALNEAYSDIWGETVDLNNGRLDEDEGDITTKRPDGLCASHSRPQPQVVINSPASLAKTCVAGPAAFGPRVTHEGITSDIVQALDEANPAGQSTTDGCTALTNGAAVSGKVALVDRGTCPFTVKVKNAQDAGASAVLIGNINSGGQFSPPGADATITIPSVGISQANRDRIVGGLASGAVNVTLKDSSSVEKTDSYRWLMGEDSTAFGGAIRDMWNPTCYGHPGKVSDAEYHCDTDDGGGVHRNSGIPNHGYALLVDGGSYNDVNVTGLGFDKAAAIYFRAMTEYQTPLSDFSDHADSLEASCTDLIGKELKKVSTAASDSVPSTEVIAATDCAQVAAMAQAVQLRTEPVQCNFKPMLDPNAPDVCRANQKQNVVWKDDFEQGLAAWTTENEVVFPEGKNLPWEANTSAPGGHAGGVAYGRGTGEGDCAGGADDYSSRDSIVSPIVQLPGSAAKAPRVTFDHYMATEPGYDGGNVKIKVNGGDWELIPAAAYTFNMPKATMTAAPGNTSPIAGEEGFTGTDGGKPTGSWGQSQIDLSMVGVTAGDDIQLRFDFGRDGCGGRDGWYVDNVTVSTCKVKAKLAGVHVPNPSTYGKASKVKVTVSPDGSQGEGPTGDVVLKSSTGSVVARGVLDDGVAEIALPATFKVGTSTLVAQYKGDAIYGTATGDVAVKVNKATSKTAATVKPTSVKKGAKFAVTSKITATGVTPSGTVKVYKGTRLLATGKLVGGTVKITVGTGSLSVGTHKLTVKYAGSTTVAASQGTVTIKVTR